MAHNVSSNPSERPRGKAWLVLLAVIAGAVLFAIALLGSNHRRDQQGQNAGATVPEPKLAKLEPRVAEAVRAAREAVVADPSNLTAWTRYANTLDVHDLYPEAVAAYRQALKLKPDDIQLNYLLAAVLWHVRDGKQEAETLLRSIAELQPKYPPPFARLGTWLAASGRYEEAREPLERALDIDPSFAYARRELGGVLIELGLYDDALFHLETLQEADPNDRRLQEYLARAYRATDRLKEAALAEEQARRADDTIKLSDPVRDALEPLGVSGWHCYRRALRFITEGKFAKADQELTTVRQTLWSNPDVRLGLAQAYHRRDRKTDALREYRATLTLRPDDPRAHLGVAILLNARRQFSSALAHWRIAVDAFPHDGETQLGYADCLAAVGSLKGAVKHYALAGTLGTPTPESLTNWGTALMRTGDSDGAVEKYTRALKLDPGYADAHFNLGLAYEQMGRTQDAIAEYKLGAKSNPRHPAIKRLKELEKKTTP